MFKKIFNSDNLPVLFFTLFFIWAITFLFFVLKNKPSAIEQNNKQEILTTSVREELTRRSENLGYNVIDIHCDNTMFKYREYSYDDTDLCVVKTDLGNLYYMKRRSDFYLIIK